MPWTALTHTPDTLPILALALAIEAAAGYPDALYRALGHPVTWIGRLIGTLDTGLNRGDPIRRRIAGICALVVVLAVVASVALALSALAGLAGLWPGSVLLGLACAALPAQRSLHDHVARVAEGLRSDGLAGGRSAVAMIVGRDPESLDEAGICRAAIESLSENFSDGIVAPAFWIGVGGLPGGALYKAVNTADSMIGHRTPRYEAFGWAAARLDDVLNLIPARLTAILIAVTHRHFDSTPILRDGPLHRSPNAGWPEAAMAVVLNVALSGPRSYHGVRRDFPWVWPEGRRDPGPRDIEAACSALWRAWAGMLVVVALLWWA